MGGYAEGEKGPGFPWLGCLGALATLVGLGLGVGSFASGHAVEAHQQEEAALFAQLAADGLAVSPEALIPPPLPANDLDRLQSVLTRVEQLPSDEQAALELYRLEAFAKPKEEVFAGSDQEQQQLDDPALWKEATQRVQETLKEIGPDLDLVLQQPVVSFDVDWSKGFTIELPHLMPIKQLTLALCGRAILRVRQGRTAEGWRDLARAAELQARHREPTLISYLVKVACMGIVIDGVQKALEYGPPPPDAEWNRLDSALIQLDDPSNVTYAFQSELHCATSGLPLDVSQLGSWMTQEFGGMGVAYRVPVFGRWKWSEHRLEYMRLMAEAVRATELEPLQAKDALLRLEQGVKGKGAITQMLFPALVKVVDRDLQHRASLRMARMGMHLARAVGEGELPRELPDPLLGDPTSPTSRPIQWRREGPRHGRLWCVSGNGSDEGGEYTEGTSPASPDQIFDVRLPGAPARPTQAEAAQAGQVR
ncbi:MAG TPA: hypothetical protein DEA08_17640 [Planctomycetes bacterium]|nr:hypothetical protein [Planctomycetota bacterium]